MMTKPKPGIPSMHLLAEDTTTSKAISLMVNGTAPKELIASMIRLLPCAFTTSAISRSGLRMPELVSQWTRKTLVMSGLSLSRASTSSGCGGR
ncbi:hypothetical protein D3C81_1748670 [compost metagenome]